MVRRLKAKLTHAFALLRAYQHKVKHMGVAATSEPNLHSSNALDPKGTQQLYCQPCGQNEFLTCSAKAGRLAGHNVHTPSQLEAHEMLSVDRGCQHPADAGRHCQHNLGPVPCTQQQHERVSGQASNESSRSAVRQEPFAELASEVLAWQQGDAGIEGTAAAQEACKVLRFDPALGTDGGFYFITSQSLCTQPRPAGQNEQDQVAAASPSSHQQAAIVPAQQQHSAPTDGLPNQRLQLPASESAQTAMQSGSEADGTQADVATGQKTGQAISDSGHGSVIMAEAGTAQLQLMQANAAEDVGKQQAGAQAQPAFPVQGGGEAGVLLRAAAAAAAGCSHELVVAAAGRARLEEEPGSNSRYKSLISLSCCLKCCSASLSQCCNSIRLSSWSHPTYCNLTRLAS